MGGTWGDIEKEYMRAEELARRHGIAFVGNEYVSEEEYEDDWVRLLDVIPVIAALEAENERLRGALEYIVERYESDDETGYVAANMYEAARAALAAAGYAEDE